MIAVAICTACAEIRAKSTREYQRGERVNPDDFQPVGDQPQPRHGEPATCYACGGTLLIRFAADALANGHPERALPPPSPAAAPAEPGVVTLFAAVAGEEVKEIKPLGTRLLVITNRRIVLINPEEAL